MKKIIFFLLVFVLVSCGENADNKKNKFEYKKIEKKEDNLDKKSKEAVIILNSSDLMKFDQNFGFEDKIFVKFWFYGFRGLVVQEYSMVVFGGMVCCGIW